jgi:hypothetical protein
MCREFAPVLGHSWQDFWYDVSKTVTSFVIDEWHLSRQHAG